METVFSQLLQANVSRKRAVSAIVRHIKLTGEDSLLTPDVLQELTVPLPVPLQPPPKPVSIDPLAEMSDEPAKRPHKWSRHKTLAEVLLYLSYKSDEMITRSQSQLNELVRQIYYHQGMTPKVADGHGFRLILSRLRTGGYYTNLPKIDTTGPFDGLVFIEPRLAELDKILGVQWSDWLVKAERKRNEK